MEGFTVSAEAPSCPVLPTPSPRQCPGLSHTRLLGSCSLCTPSLPPTCTWLTRRSALFSFDVKLKYDEMFALKCLVTEFRQTNACKNPNSCQDVQRCHHLLAYFELKFFSSFLKSFQILNGFKTSKYKRFHVPFSQRPQRRPDHLWAPPAITAVPHHNHCPPP